MADLGRTIRNRGSCNGDRHYHIVYRFSMDTVRTLRANLDFDRYDFVQRLRRSIVQVLGGHAGYNALQTIRRDYYVG